MTTQTQTTYQAILNESFLLIFTTKNPEHGIGADFSLLLSCYTRQAYEEILGGKKEADKWIKKYHTEREEGMKLGIHYLLNN